MGRLRAPELLVGITAILAAMTMLSACDAVTRGLATRLPTMVIICLRSIPGVIPVLMLVQAEHAWGQLVRRRPAIQLLRGALMVGSYALYLQSLTGGVSFALSVALVYTSPLFVAALSPVMLGERVPAIRWAGTMVGFAGVLVAVRPGFGAFNPVALCALGSGLLYAVSALLARRLGRTDPPAVTSFYTWLMFLLGGFPFTLALPWTFPGAEDLALVAVVGIVAGTAHYFIIVAYRHAPAAIIAPLEYVSMGWATLFGLVFWHEHPDLPTLAGIGLIVAGGLVLLYASRPGRRTAAKAA